MSDAPPRERLNRLAELAAETGVEARRKLTGELADLLLDWPSVYPQSMREPFEALLERALTDLEPQARALLAERFAQRPGTPLALLNGLIFDAAPQLRAEILARNASSDFASRNPPAGEGGLLTAIRSAQLTEMADVLSSQLHIPRATAERIVKDGSAQMLAALCQGAGLSRPTFSALAVLAAPFADADEHYRRLAAYDDVPPPAARGLVCFWQKQAEVPAPARAA